MTMFYRLRWRWLRLVAWYYWTFWRRDYLLERMRSRAQEEQSAPNDYDIPF